MDYYLIQSIKRGEIIKGKSLFISLILLSVILLSVSTAFAATDDVMGGVDDEIAIDERVLAIDDNSLELENADEAVLAENLTPSDSNVVTKDTFYEYFDDGGNILSNVTGDKLVFEGDFSNVSVNYITIDKPISFEGNNATFSNVSFVIAADNVSIDGFNLYMYGTDTSLISIGDVSNITIANNEIYYKSMDGFNGYGIFAYDVDALKLLNNTLTYVGNTDGESINNAVLVYGDEKKSTNILVEGNVFNITIPSSKVGYDEDYNSLSYTDGLVFKGCENITLTNNDISLNYNNSVGSYDTIHVLVIGNSNYELDYSTWDILYPNVCDNVFVSSNNITANGHTYLYGISIVANNYEIKDNNIDLSSDEHYVAAFEIGGPTVNGTISDNLINTTAPNLAFGIYSYSYMGAIEDMTYENNTIIGDAYAACGMEIVNANPVIKNNVITLNGNHTTGIVANMGDEGSIVDNEIYSLGTNVGTAPTGDSYVHDESTGIGVNGDTLISGNTIVSTAIGVNLKNYGSKGDIVLSNNTITVNATGDENNYALYAEKIDGLTVSENNITFIGNTDGSIVSNGVYINGIDKTQIDKNNFDITVVSSYVPWAEVPAGSGNWVSSPVSEGIVIDSSKAVVFKDNNVDVSYSTVLGAYDTIYAVDFKNSDDALINNNVINDLGHTYIYGIIITGNNFNISANNITSESDIFYANGIDIEGPATGVVENNNIAVKAPVSGYAIYSGMNGADVSANYTNNNITGDAYNVFAFSLGDVESNIENNNVVINGNYTTGIAFRGSAINANGNRFILQSSEVGNESIWENFGVEAVGIKVIAGNATLSDNVIAGPGKGILVVDANADIKNNFINTVANDDKDACAIYATDVASLNINNNTVDYQGTTKGTGMNNAVYLSNATGATITENKFNFELVSSYVPWAEVPAGSGNWVSSPISEGIVISGSDDVAFDSNAVNVTYGDVVGSYDTIYAVDFKDSDNAAITNNEIKALGHTYIYGIIITGNNFNISANNITSESDNYYANGIDIEGPATGVVENNNINVKGIVSAYAIYSGMNGANVSANYTNNNIVADAYNVFGMSLGDVESNVADTKLTLNGNYTTGIAYRGSKLTVDNTIILANGTNVGNESIWEGFGVETIGIKVIQGNATITNNNIKATGNYTVDVKDTAASVHDNYLLASELFGNKSVTFTGAADVHDNIPIADSNVTISQINEVVVDLPEDATGTVTVTVDGKEYAAVAVNGSVKVPLENLSNGNHDVEVKYSGDNKYAPKTSTLTAFVSKPKIDTIITADAAFTRWATDYNAGERGAMFYITLTDVNGNPLANKTIQFAINGKFYNNTTDENGKAGLQINIAPANTYTYAFMFQGDDDYNACPLAQSKLTVKAKTTSISASAKTFKSTAKTKKITVTLKTIKNAYNGKTYLQAGKKLTLKINGKTYTAKINAKGQATFSIKLTKKGKFTALIKFAGDRTYKASSKKITVTIK